MESRHRNRVILLCFAVGILEGYDIQIVGVTAPALARYFGLLPADLSVLFVGSNFGLMIGALAGGWLADRLGRRPVLIASVVLFALFTLATALASSFGALVAFRLLAGLGLGAALPNLVATAADVSSVTRRGFVTGLMFCGVPLGGSVVALLSQFNVEVIGWRELFMIGGALPLAVACLLWFALPETRPLGVIQSGKVPLSLLFTGGRWRQTFLLWGMVAPTLMAVYLVLYWLPTLIVAKNLPVGVAAYAAAAFSLAGVAGAVALGAAADRTNSGILLVGGYLAFIAAVAALGPADSAAAVLVLSGLAGFFLLGLNYAAYGMAGAHYPAAIRATGSGAAIGAGRVGSLIGPLLPGLLLSRGIGQQGVFWLLIPIALLAAGSLSALLWQTRERPETAGDGVNPETLAEPSA